MTDPVHQGGQTARAGGAKAVAAFLGGVVATAFVGFAFFDWHTGATARTMALNAAQAAQTELAATVCVKRFIEAPDLAGRLSELKAQARFNQDGFIERGGWVELSGSPHPTYDAADICADRLLRLEMPEAVELPEITES